MGKCRADHHLGMERLRSKYTSVECYTMENRCNGYLNGLQCNIRIEGKLRKVFM